MAAYRLPHWMTVIVALPKLCREPAIRQFEPSAATSQEGHMESLLVTRASRTATPPPCPSPRPCSFCDNCNSACDRCVSGASHTGRRSAGNQRLARDDGITS